MKKYVLVIFLHLAFGLALKGQVVENTPQQEASILLQTQPTYTLADTFLVERFNDSAFALRNIDISTAATLAKKGRELAETIAYQKGLARAIGYQGLMAYRQGKYDFAIDYHLQSLKIASKIGDSTLIAYRYNDLANVYGDKGDMVKALEYNQKSLALKRIKGDEEGIATSLRNLGLFNLRYTKGDLNLAINYLLEAEQLAKKIDDQRLLGYIYTYLGEIHSRNYNHKSAIDFYNKAEAINLGINNQYGLAETLNSFGDAYLLAKNDSFAVFKFEKALKLAQQLGIKLEVQRAYLGLSKAFEKQKKYANALNAFSKYAQIRDSLFNERNAEYIEYLDAHFQSELKESEINLLQKEQTLKQKEIEQEKLKSQRFIMIFGFSTLLLLIAIFGIYHFRKVNSILLAQKADLIKQKEEIKIKSEELEKLNNFKDKLFSIIAHDLRSPMASLKGTIDILDPDIINAKELEQIKQEISRKFESTDDTLQNLLIWASQQMQGERIDTKNIPLKKLIETRFPTLIATAKNKNISIINRIEDGIEVMADEIHLLTIIRNLLSNAIKFSFSGGEIIIFSKVAGEKIQIGIQDKGKGMDLAQQATLFQENFQSTPGTLGEKGNGLGLGIVKHLIEKNRGKIWVNSLPGKGSTFYFSLPTNKALVV